MGQGSHCQGSGHNRDVSKKRGFFLTTHLAMVPDGPTWVCAIALAGVNLTGLVYVLRPA